MNDHVPDIDQLFAERLRVDLWQEDIMARVSRYFMDFERIAEEHGLTSLARPSPTPTEKGRQRIKFVRHAFDAKHSTGGAPGGDCVACHADAPVRSGRRRRAAWLARRVNNKTPPGASDDRRGLCRGAPVRRAAGSQETCEVWQYLQQLQQQV